MDLALMPLTIDDAALLALAGLGHRWTEGFADRVRYRWLLPPEFVFAADLPARPSRGIVPLCGGGDRAGGLTAVLGYLAGTDVAPTTLISRNLGAGVAVASFSSRTGQVAERVEHRDGRQMVTTVHAFQSGGRPHRFVVAVIGQMGTNDLAKLRTIGTALSLADTAQTSTLEATRGRQMGRLMA